MIAALLGLAGCAGPAPVAASCERSLPAGSAPDVLLVVVDTLRADHLPAWGYDRDTAPAFSAWAEQQLLFEAAVSQGGWTLPAITALFTGLWPPSSGSTRGNLDERFTLLAERFQQAGYATYARTKAAVYSEGMGYAQGFDSFAYVEGDFSSLDSAEQLTDEALAVLDEATCDRQRPVFLFIHYLDPHLDYEAPEPWYDRYDTSGSHVPGTYETILSYKIEGRAPPPEDIARLEALYDGEIAYWDTQFKRLIEGAEATLDAPAILVLGDHGEQLYEHGGGAHEHLWQENLHVPLVLHWPGMAPRRVAERVRTADLSPTLAALLGWEADPLWQAQDLSAVVLDGASPPPAEVFSVYNERSALIDPEGWKIVRERERDYLFDLGTDPGELADQAAAQPARLAALQARLEALDAACQAVAEAVLGPSSPEGRQRR